jgi:hypothetical protein
MLQYWRDYYAYLRVYPGQGDQGAKTYALAGAMRGMEVAIGSRLIGGSLR